MEGLMNLIRWLFGPVLVFGLIACTQDVIPNPAPLSIKQSSLEITVQGVAKAGVQVSNTSKSVFQGIVAGKHTLTLNAGQYSVDGMPVNGFRDPSPITIKLDPGMSVKAQLIYQQSEPASGVVAKLEIVSVKDASGATLPSHKEVNDNKNVKLYASQTEEAVSVTLKATDAQGVAVRNANIVVNVSELFGDHVAIIRGRAAIQGNQLAAAAFRDGILTDSNGNAVFSLYATFGALNTHKDSMLLLDQPAKVVVAAENANATSVLEEFKVFFVNISHLYFNGTASGQRVGKVFPEAVNRFKPLNNRTDRGDPDTNEHPISASLFVKQPQAKITLPNEMFNFKFELSSSEKVGFVPGTYDSLSGDATAYDRDGSVRIEPKDGLGLKDLPIQASVKVTLITKFKYGTTTYEFPLKDFTAQKRWIGSYLSISKSIDHHVLTWAGPEHHLNKVSGVDPSNFIGGKNDHTLAAKDDPAVAASSVFTATASLTVKNVGLDPVYNVTIADALPAELGVISSTVQPIGATYDGSGHVVTWNWQNTPDPRFDKLMPNESINVTFQVYLRQKPGFAWDKDDLAKTATYQVKPVYQAAYPDPYKVVNGAALEDVTGTWFTGAPLSSNPSTSGHQVKVDFNGSAFENDVVIHGVRPIFEIEKKLINPAQPMDVGQVAYFDIKIKNADRHPRYDGLMATYPSEFNGQVPSSRDNPYGRNLRLTDIFDTGLDFVSGLPLNVLDDEGIAPASSFSLTPIPDKGVVWKIVPILGGGDSGTTQLALRANLPSPMDTAKLSSIAKCLPEPYWYNCAYLDADNLNQPQIDGMDWKQLEARPWDANPLHHNDLIDLRYGIRDCAKVTVILQQEPWIELDSISEWNQGDPTGAVQLLGVHQGTSYFYYMTVTNHGGATATDVRYTANLSGGVASFSGGTSEQQAFLSTDGGITWSFSFDASSVNPSSVTFPTTNLMPGQMLLYTTRTSADLVGSATANGTATYSNPGIQTPFLPAMVLENTQIQQP